MRTFFVCLAALCLFFSAAQAQDSTFLDKAITRALNTNLQLQQRQMNIEKAWLALEEAKGLFLPTVNFLAEYTVAQGGRKIDFPIGDLINPVYSTLNQLTGTGAFPTLQNQEIQFLPNDFHDTRLQILYPLINSEIRYNKRIKNAQITQQQAETNVYSRELVKEVKVAYYRYLQAYKAIGIYENAAKLLDENRRLTQSLAANDLVLKSDLLRVEAAQRQNEAQLAEARNNAEVAKAYFNFLLNQDLATAILVEEEKTNTAAPIWQFAGEREELAALKSGTEQLTLVRNMRKQTAWQPTLNLFGNVGFQGFGYKFNGDQAYYLAGFQLKWNLFSGYQQKFKIQQADLDLKQLQLRYTETEKQLQLQLKQANHNLLSAIAKAESTEAALGFSREFYRQTQARYRSGEALIVELQDAFTQLLNQELAAEITKTDLRIRQAELDRIAAVQ